MDYFQGVVTEYLRANRATFVNTECCIQLNPGDNPDTSGPHWYCDALAVNLEKKQAYLCEVTYSKSLAALMKRLANWAEHWPQLRAALARDCGIPQEWPARPWVFVPNELRSVLDAQLKKVPNLGTGGLQMPPPIVTPLEDVMPWKYRAYNRAHHDHDGDA